MKKYLFTIPIKFHQNEGMKNRIGFFIQRKDLFDF